LIHYCSIKPSLKGDLVFVAQAVKPAEPRLIRLGFSWCARSGHESEFYDSSVLADGEESLGKRRKAEMTLGSAGLTACPTCLYMNSISCARFVTLFGPSSVACLGTSSTISYATRSFVGFVRSNRGWNWVL